MTVELSTRRDITLEAVRRVAWEEEGVRITEAALARMAPISPPASMPRRRDQVTGLNCLPSCRAWPW